MKTTTKTTRILFLTLGKPRKKIDPDDPSRLIDEYDKTVYKFPSGETSPQEETPYIAEAHVKRKVYRGIYLLGTKESIWSEFYFHLANSEGSEFADEGLDEIEEGNLLPLEELISEMGAPDLKEVQCEATATGENETDFWEIFQEVASLLEKARSTQKDKQDVIEVDVDLTHGLRYLPVFILRSLEYLSALYDNVRIGRVYYGAYDLPESDTFNTPVFDLEPLKIMSAWQKAAENFNEYGDLSRLIRLMKKREVSQSLILATIQFSDALGMSTLHPSQISDAADQFISALERETEIESPTNMPLILLKDQLLSFPHSLSACQLDSEKLLKISVRFAQSDQLLSLGLTVLWEAIIQRMEELFEILPGKGTRGSNSSLHSVFSNITTFSKTSHQLLSNRSDFLKEWGDHAFILRGIRNDLSHIVYTKPHKSLGKGENFERIVYTMESIREKYELAADFFTKNWMNNDLHEFPPLFARYEPLDRYRRYMS